MSEKIIIFDSTLRDGAQAEGISFSVEDKIRVMETLDKIGVDYIEAGNPGSNPKDIEFFNRIKGMQLKHAKLVAFGSTRRGGIAVEEDANLKAILETQTPAVAIFGKSWTFHITDIIKTTLEENLRMIEETMAYLKAKGKDVTFDAEHFFDGYKNDPVYAIESLLAAQAGGADCLALCDTNGGTLPVEIQEIVTDVRKKLDIPLGIHCHNDSGVAVANSLMAVQAGARQVQGTFLGYGERCGNANLSSIIPNLQLKLGYNCLAEDELLKLTSSAIRIAEISNYILSGREPFVGKSAFAHKGGMHIDAVMKNPASFEHVPPESVGNERRILMSEVSGRSTIIQLINEVDPSLTKKSEETTRVMDRIKELEYQGYQFEGAESSVKLLIRKELGKYKPFFTLEDFKTIGEQPHTKEGLSSSAVVKINVDGQSEINAAEGDGPVNALDKALRKALEVFFPKISEVRLTDFKVRVIDSKAATASKVRVLIESSDGVDIWTNVGVSTDVIEASLIALIDSIEYKLLNDMERKLKEYKLM
ncbi:citramalate synthase [Acetobacterium tundrae]|uniref:Citramalate synthase n=1 Tax=Acetobacterium tundrae TaxID=132932 RepID=A0ABR6WGV8_9FIRM|nr:citramalate synthase [Acetobacterium tundrae]MBC3795714.1 citramalate synthase [Acetobacterium tundrae]